MKRIAPIFLLSIFLYNVVGYFAVFSVRDYTNRVQIRENMERNWPLEKIVIHQSELKTIALKDSGNEFCLNGEMYDVKSKTTKGDYIVFMCVKDKEEKQLLADLKKNTENNSPLSDLAKKFAKDFYFTANTVSVPCSSSYTIQLSIVNRQLSIFLPLPSPPPRISFS